MKMKKTITLSLLVIGLQVVGGKEEFIQRKEKEDQRLVNNLVSLVTNGETDWVNGLEAVLDPSQCTPSEIKLVVEDPRFVKLVSEHAPLKDSQGRTLLHAAAFNYPGLCSGLVKQKPELAFLRDNREGETVLETAKRPSLKKALEKILFKTWKGDLLEGDDYKYREFFWDLVRKAQGSGFEKESFWLTDIRNILDVSEKMPELERLGQAVKAYNKKHEKPLVDNQNNDVAYEISKAQDDKRDKNTRKWVEGFVKQVKKKELSWEKAFNKINWIGHPKLFKFLVWHASTKDSDGKTLIGAAEESSHPEAKSLIEGLCKLKPSLKNKA